MGGGLIEEMLEFYSVISPDPILDATYNAGRFWSDRFYGHSTRARHGSQS